MKYDYSMILSNVENSVAEDDIFTGEAEGSTPRQAIKDVLNKRTEWLEDEFAGLSPTIEISKNTTLEGFEAEVDSHGLGNASIILLPFNSLPARMKVS